MISTVGYEMKQTITLNIILMLLVTTKLLKKNVVKVADFFIAVYT